MRVRSWPSTLSAPDRRRPTSRRTTAPRRRPQATRHVLLETTDLTGDRFSRLLRRVCWGVALTLALIVIGLTIFRLQYRERILPAVAVADVPVGGLTRLEAEERLRQRAAILETQTVTFQYGDHTWKPTLGELGVEIAVEDAIAAAYAVGREDDASNRLRTTQNLLHDNEVVPLRFHVDGATMERWFDRVDQELDMVPREASLTIEGTTVTINPDQDGTVIDRTVAHDQIITALNSLTPLNAPLPTKAVTPRIRAADLEQAKAEVTTALSDSIHLTDGEETWTLQPGDLGSFIVIRTDGPGVGAAVVRVEMDTDALAKWLSDQIRDQVNIDPVNAEVRWVGGGVEAIRASQNGRKLRSDDLARAVANSFLSDHAEVTVPVEIVEPAVDENNLDALGITHQLAVGDSDYTFGDDNRDNNVEVGTALLNGTLIPPHADFSFNRAIGEITAEKGYVESVVVEEDRAGRDIGGGICQVSTTTFRAALMAGLPIVEWWPHTYRQSGYEVDGWKAGFDASILQPEGDPFGGGDFKFNNPTDSWMLIEAYTDGTKVRVVIYGPKMDYRVEITDHVLEGPIATNQDIEVVDDSLPPGTIQQTEWPLEGWNLLFVRDVYNRDGELIESRTFYVEFKGRSNVWRVSPDMEGQSPANVNW